MTLSLKTVCTRLAPGLLLAMLAAAPALAQDGEGQEPGGDSTMSSQGGLRIGTGKEGNKVMVIESKPRSRQEAPDLGPVIVTPEVNRNRSRGPSFMPPPSPRPGQAR